jgi:hypothetical protein
MAEKVSIDSNIRLTPICGVDACGFIEDFSVEHIGNSFLYDRDSDCLYTESGGLISSNINWAKPTIDDMNRVVYKVKSTFVSGIYETIVQDSIASATYKITDREIVEKDESIELLTIPKYNSIEEKLEKAKQDKRPRWQIKSSKWSWDEIISEQNQSNCEYCDNNRKTILRTHVEKGRVLSGKILTDKHITNEYCRKCLSVDIAAEDMIRYVKPDLCLETRSQKTYEVEDGYRKILSDKNQDYNCIISVSPEEDGYLATVELVNSYSVHSRLLERETPTISNRNSAREAAERASELYERFWSGEKYGDLSFVEVDETILN